MPANIRTIPPNPRSRVRPSTAVRPFKLVDETNFKLIAKQVFQEEGQLSVLSRQRVLFIDKLKTVDVRAFKGLLEELRFREGGALIWLQDRTAPALNMQFIEFLEYKLSHTPEPPLSFRSNECLHSCLFVEESIIVYCIYLGALVDINSISFAVKDIFASSVIKCMSNSIDQLAVLASFRQEAELLLDRCLPGRGADLRTKTAELITLVLGSYGSDDNDKIDKLTAVAQGKMIAAKKVGGVLPELPPGLSWPKEKFKGSPEYNKHGGIIDFLGRVWLPIIRIGLINRGHLAICDPLASKALRNYLHNGGLGRRSMPEQVFIPQQRQRPVSATTKRQMPKAVLI